MKYIIENISKIVKSIDYKTQLIGRRQRLINGVENSRFEGILIGFIFTFVFVGLPILYFKGGF